ncbi:MAG: hypothetical protein ABR530_05940 [Pyrinomonadaceae bacterium]
MNNLFNMLKILIALSLLGVVTINCSNPRTQSGSDILGIAIGMSKEAATERLQEIGSLDREERKQQEIWTLNDDPHYSHVILAYDKDKHVVRFITAKARENGTRVSYGDVMDINNSKLTSSANNYKYTQEVQAQGSAVGYTRIASGTDPKYLTYFSLKELHLPEQEVEEQKK